MFGTARNSVKPDLIIRQWVRAKGSERLHRSIQRHVDDVAGIPGIPSVRIAERDREEAMRRKDCSGSIIPARPSATRTVQQQDRGKRTIARWTVPRTTNWQGAAKNFERHENLSGSCSS